MRTPRSGSKTEFHHTDELRALDGWRAGPVQQAATRAGRRGRSIRYLPLFAWTDPKTRFNKALTRRRLLASLSLYEISLPRYGISDLGDRSGIAPEDSRRRCPWI
ncbi:hypothetical protein GCM10009533_23390 [Saccharopolyspora spinosporotrichia]|uniref:Uncharacterized protein n=1 Tax=Saccharopolyspora erythraea TaxID=1836 RepID=A0ABP3MQV2_SACER